MNPMFDVGARAGWFKKYGAGNGERKICVRPLGNRKAEYVERVFGEGESKYQYVGPLNADDSLVNGYGGVGLDILVKCECTGPNLEIVMLRRTCEKCSRDSGRRQLCCGGDWFLREAEVRNGCLEEVVASAVPEKVHNASTYFPYQLPTSAGSYSCEKLVVQGPPTDGQNQNCVRFTGLVTLYLIVAGHQTLVEVAVNPQVLSRLGGDEQRVFTPFWSKFDPDCVCKEVERPSQCLICHCTPLESEDDFKPMCSQGTCKMYLCQGCSRGYSNGIGQQTYDWGRRARYTCAAGCREVKGADVRSVHGENQFERMTRLANEERVRYREFLTRDEFLENYPRGTPLPDPDRFSRSASPEMNI